MGAAVRITCVREVVTVSWKDMQQKLSTDPQDQKKMLSSRKKIADAMGLLSCQWGPLAESKQGIMQS